MKFRCSSATLYRSAVGMFFIVVLLLSSSQRGSGFPTLTRWRADDNYYYLESTGIPIHKLMVGITAWQQQVPLPQDFTGDNAFRIPRHPIESNNPVDAKEALFSGAIAVAINGIPIFNPIKNDGKTDTFTAGELDDFGGHCGRADDYHYHTAPLHLQDAVGIANPIAYALDGYKIYGLTEPDGSAPVGLDKFNGHKNASGEYHYHATKTYPYLNGGMHGNVKVVKDAITPQPLTTPSRQWLMPLRGAKITGFYLPSPNHYSLEYTVGQKHGFVNYQQEDNNSFTFNFIDVDGNKRTENYRQPKTRLSSYLTANNAASVTVKPGASVLYGWGSTSASGGSMKLQIFKGAGTGNPVAMDACGTASGAVSNMTGKMGSATVTPAACSAGFTYKYTFTATDGNRDSSDDVTVTVAQ